MVKHFSFCFLQAKEKKPSTVVFVELFKKAVPIWAAGAKPEEETIEPGSMEALAAVSVCQMPLDLCYIAAFQAIAEAGKPPEKEKTTGTYGTLIAALQIYGMAVAVAEAPGAPLYGTAPARLHHKLCLQARQRRY